MPESPLNDERFIADIRRDMLRFALLQLRDAALAEDAVQESLAAALSGEQRFAGRSALKTWVFSILRNKIVDVIRQRRRDAHEPERCADDEAVDLNLEACYRTNGHWRPEMRPNHWSDPEESLRERRFWEIFEICLGHLPENTARVFMMREMLGFETAEICEELTLSVGNCNVIMHRARSGLRRCLETGWFAPGERPC